MKRFALMLGMVAIATPALSQTYTRGYTRSDGTYVAPHYSSSPDSTRLNNYSSQGNYNPYTGQAGTRNPYSAPSPYRAPSYSTPGYTPPVTNTYGSSGF